MTEPLSRRPLGPEPPAGPALFKRPIYRWSVVALRQNPLVTPDHEWNVVQRMIIECASFADATTVLEMLHVKPNDAEDTYVIQGSIK